ncbi:DUF4405 domain-containing protein [uncultured Winogradskyella sp.]|uniref:DUF4405 domain-containing protein n=1 Tax=uncultured Winogradskyella sp. TaxID=395353 RepID=UPI00261B2563|nr:DUF4405 domain-containing protein [uncultured Winogradskyella sp.]
MKKSVKAMRKSTWNFILNATMTLCMSAIIGIGFLIKYTLLSGQDRKEVYGQNVELYFLNMDRHQWGTIHLYLSFVLIGLLIIHVFLHWKVVTAVYQKIIKVQFTKRIVAFSFAILCTILVIVPFFINPKVEVIKKGNGRQVTLVTDFDNTLNYFCTVN